MNRLLPRALARLLWLHNKARLRRAARGMLTLRGALYSLAVVGLFALWIVPSILAGISGTPAAPALARDWLAPGLLLYGVLTLFNSGTETGIFFLPAEVDLLFPAPFSRRQLLIYRLAGLVQGSCLLAAVFLLFLMRYVTLALAGYAGILLSLVFMILVQISLGLLVSLIAETAYTRVRRGALALVGALVALGLFEALRHSEARDLAGLLGQFRQSGPGAVVLAPFELLARTITAERWYPDFLQSGSFSFLMVSALAVLVVALDANYLERSITTSQRMYERLQRVRRGGPLASAVDRRSRRIRIARLPWLGGAGPIAWRQLTTAVRSAKALLTLVPVVLAVALLPLAFGSADDSKPYAGAGVMVVVFFTLFPQWLQFDFRIDLDRIDVLKGLPVAAWAVVLGELAAPVLVASIAQFLVGLLVALLHGLLTGPWPLAALLILPANLVVFGVENLFFLLFPVRNAQLGTGDLQSVGRQMLLSLVRIMVIVLAGGLSAGLGALAWLAAGRLPVAFVSGTALTLLACGSLLVALIARVYRQFDPALHVPP